MYTIIWNTFKKHADEIVAKRTGTVPIATDSNDNVSEASTTAPQLIVEETLDSDAESVHSRRGPRRPLQQQQQSQEQKKEQEINWKVKYDELHEIVIQLVEIHKDSPLYGAFKTLLGQHF